MLTSISTCWSAHLFDAMRHLVGLPWRLHGRVATLLGYDVGVLGIAADVVPPVPLDVGLRLLRDGVAHLHGKQHGKAANHRPATTDHK